MGAWIQSISNWLWGFPMLTLVLGTGFYLIVRLRVVQVREFLPAVRLLWRTKRSGDQPKTGEGREENFFLSLPLSLILFTAFSYAAIEATKWELPVGQFPLFISAPGIALCLFVLIGDVRGVFVVGRAENGFGAALSKAAARAMLGDAGQFFGYLLAMLLLTFIIGQIAALPLVSAPTVDLREYVTDRALAGLFSVLAQEERRIRRDPAARSTALLRQVFGRN